MMEWDIYGGVIKTFTKSRRILPLHEIEDRDRYTRSTKRQVIVPGHVQNTGGWMAMLDREQPIVCTDTHHHQQHQRVEVASRPASPAPCESRRLGAPTNRTFVPKSFTRKAGDLRTLETAQGATTAASCCMGVDCRCTRHGLASR